MLLQPKTNIYLFCVENRSKSMLFDRKVTLCTCLLKRISSTKARFCRANHMSSYFFVVKTNVPRMLFHLGPTNLHSIHMREKIEPPMRRRTACSHAQTTALQVITSSSRPFSCLSSGGANTYSGCLAFSHALMTAL